LDDDWHEYFDIAVQDWDNGTPDSLTLSTKLDTPDSQCSPVDGVMKVCNGNYGETGWKGINEVSFQGRTILASVAKMNEAYFEGSQDSENKRQYTMCHEIGHGFGLPHTDEKFWNRDLGNCKLYGMKHFSKENNSRESNLLTSLNASRCRIIRSRLYE